MTTGFPGGRPGLLRPVDKPRRGPLGVRSMRVGHVLGLRRGLAIVPTGVGGEPPVLDVDFHGRRPASRTLDGTERAIAPGRHPALSRLIPPYPGSFFLFARKHRPAAVSGGG